MEVKLALSCEVHREGLKTPEHSRRSVTDDLHSKEVFTSADVKASDNHLNY